MSHSGNKYKRKIARDKDGYSDVYDVLIGFNVTCPARQHAIKKQLCSGIRGKGDERQDVKEAIDALSRSLELIPTEERSESND